jgi:hypothetical protein
MATAMRCCGAQGARSYTVRMTSEVIRIGFEVGSLYLYCWNEIATALLNKFGDTLYRRTDTAIILQQRVVTVDHMTTWQISHQHAPCAWCIKSD